MSNSKAVPKDRIRIFNRAGAPLAEFRAAVDRSYAIGEEARAQFEYPSRKRDVVNNTVLRFGNWLLIENTALPTWVGVIDTPREWGVRTVRVSAYTPEHVFGWRRGPLEDVIVGTASSIFKRLLRLVNTAENTVIREGVIRAGSVRMQETLNPTKLNEDLQRIQQRSLEEYAWRAATDVSGKLIVYADWVKLLGVDTGVILQEGKGGGNIEAEREIMVEDGPIVNDLMGFGEGETWKTKKKYTAKDATSRALYGLRQSSEEWYDVSSEGTLRNNTITALNDLKEPKRTFHINALNTGDTFKYLRLGNKLNLLLENIGFDRTGTHYQTTIRILAMSYDSAVPNKLELVVEEQT